MIATRPIELIYKKVFKPLAFRQDPETVHDRITKVGKLLGRNKFLSRATSLFFKYENLILEQEILGIKFSNPIGLSAGFDKNAELLGILPHVGFGFAEVGSITGEPCLGNPKPRLWRLPAIQSLAVYYGLKNDGAKAIARRLRNKKFLFPVGISVAKTNSPDTVETEKGIADYLKAYKEFADIGSYTTINISCPNAFGGEPFTDPEKLDQLLAEIDKVETKKPVFVKLSPDLSTEEIDALLEIIDKHKVHGLICTNLTKKNNTFAHTKGGLSGKAVEDLSNNLIAHVYKKTGGKYVIMGSGGVFSAADAYKKIKLGASLIQMITGMIFEGPQVIGEINRGLAKLLRQDGFKNISDAAGIDAKI